MMTVSTAIALTANTVHMIGCCGFWKTLTVLFGVPTHIARDPANSFSSGRGIYKAFYLLVNS